MMGARGPVKMAAVLVTVVTTAAVLAQLLPTAAGGTLEVLTERRRRDTDSSESSHELGNNGGAGGGVSHGGGPAGGRHPLVYNHVYTINLPPSALCDPAPEDGHAAAAGSAAGDGPGAGSAPLDVGGAAGVPRGDGVAGSGMFVEQTEDSDSQIVFTHRINVPRRACGCLGGGDDDPLLRQLLGRIELLELQVSTLRQQCAPNGNGYGCCGGGGGGASAAAGNVDYLPPCGGHGNFSLETCGCSCDEGWGGANCSEPLCPGLCGDHGRCVDGECLCHEGFAGELCDAPRCADDCNDNGRCVDGQCLCFEGFEGDACHLPACPDGCNDQGRCVDGACRCYEGYTGERCDVTDGTPTEEEDGRQERDKNGHDDDDDDKEKEEEEEEVQETGSQVLGSAMCPSNCSGLGACVDGGCVCSEGVLGEDCSEVPPPRNVTVTGVTDRTVDLAWVGDVVVTEYVLSYAPVAPGGLELEMRVTGDASNATLRQLEPGVEYLVNVRAVLNGVLSVPVSARFLTLLSKPEGLRFKSIQETEVEIVWEPFSFAPDGWQITFHRGTEDAVTELPGGATSHVQSGLLPGEEYEVQLVALLDSLQSAPATATLTTPLDPPRNLKASQQGDTSLRLEWDNSRAEVDGYRVVFGPIAGGPHGSVNVTQGPNLTSAVTLSDLMPGTEYGVGVTAHRDDLQSKPATINTRTEMDSPLNLHVVRAWDTGITIRWDPCRSRVDRYTIMHISGSGAIGELAVPGSQTSANLTGLRPATEYTVVLQAESGLDKSRPSTLSANTALNPPMKLSFYNVTQTSVTVGWAARHPTPSSYRLSFEVTGGDGERETVSLAGGVTEYTLEDLAPGTDYTIGIAYLPDPDDNDPSTGTVTTAMDGPVALLAVNVTSSEALLVWRPGRAPADSYVLTYAPRGHPGGTVETINVPAPGQEQQLTGLHPATTYHATVRAVKGRLESPPESTTFSTASDSPLALSFGDVTDSTVEVTWLPPSPAPDWFRLSYVPTDGGEVESVTVAGSQVSHTLKGLSPGTEYEVSVASLRGAEDGEPISSSVTTAIDAPRDLAAVEVAGQSALLTWRPPLANITGYTLQLLGPGGDATEVELSARASSRRLDGLTRSTPYRASLHALRGKQRSRAALADFTTDGRLIQNPQDCAEQLLNGEAESRVYTVYAQNNASQPLIVFCDMSTDGGGWIVFQRRQNGHTEFFRDWKSYARGFGNPHDEFWLGLDNLHQLTRQGRYDLRVDLHDGAEEAYALYDRFTVADATALYRLRIGEFSGTAGDSLSYHQGRPFSAPDRDNDVAVTNCAISYKGAWWYKNCHRVNLNGKYGESSHSQGINWFHWKGHEHSIPFVEMKMRPHGFVRPPGERR